MIGRRSLILLVIASICLQFVAGKDLLMFGPVSRTVSVQTKNLVLDVTTGSVEDYQERRGPFRIEIGGYITYVTGYTFDPNVEIAKNNCVPVEKLDEKLRSKKKPSVRFDIDDLNGNGDSITNVTSITSIKATDVSITYIGEYSNGYPYSKRFKCNPKFETIDEDKFEYSVSMKLAGRGLPSAFELRSSAQLYEPTTPSPAPTSMSEQGLVLVICFSVGIPLLLSMICSSGVYAYWRFVKGKKAATKQSAEATADNKVVSVESGINTKSPKKETPRSQKDRDAEVRISPCGRFSLFAPAYLLSSLKKQEIYFYCCNEIFSVKCWSVLSLSGRFVFQWDSNPWPHGFPRCRRRRRRPLLVPLDRRERRLYFQPSKKVPTFWRMLPLLPPVSLCRPRR